VVDQHGRPGRIVAIPIRRVAVEDDDGRTAGDEATPGFVVGVTAGSDEHAVEAAAPEFCRGGPLACRFVGGIGDDQQIAGVAQPRFCRLDGAGVERVGDVRYQAADHAAGARTQAAGEEVGLVAELLGGRRHVARNARADMLAAVQCPRGRTQGNPGRLCNVADRDSTHLETISYPIFL
jgi:hypothetical protein